MTPQHHIIKETSETLSRLLQDEFKRNGYKRVHIVEQAPKPDAVEGKLPAVSVYLYQMSIDPPWKKRYALGWYRPGQYVPYKYYQVPWNTQAAITEAGVLTGAYFLFAPGISP